MRRYFSSDEVQMADKHKNCWNSLNIREIKIKIAQDSIRLMLFEQWDPKI